MRYIQLKTDSEVTLNEMYRNHSKYQLRQRAHALLLSNSGLQINGIAKVLGIDRQSVVRCFNNWDKKGLGGIYNESGRGRKPIFTPKEEKVVVKIINSTPRKIEGAIPQIEKETGKTGSKSTLKRILEKAEYTWRRIRKSLKNKRNEEDFRAAQDELNELKNLEDKGLIDLVFFDESGFSLVPYLPYAWQKKGQTIEVPSAQSQTLNILGFMKRDNSLEPYSLQGSANSSAIVCIFNDYVSHVVDQRKEHEPPKQGVEPKKTYIIIDNAPIHNSAEFRKNEPRWEAQGVIVKRIPPYSPELNLIEILWRKMKYEWIGFDAYESFEKLVEWVENMLKGFGSKYIINFG